MASRFSRTASAPARRRGACSATAADLQPRLSRQCARGRRPRTVPRPPAPVFARFPDWTLSSCPQITTGGIIDDSDAAFEWLPDRGLLNLIRLLLPHPSALRAKRRFSLSRPAECQRYRLSAAFAGRVRPLTGAVLRSIRSRRKRELRRDPRILRRWPSPNPTARPG